MKLKAKLILSFSSVLILFAASVFLIVINKVNSMEGSNFLKNVEIGSKLGESYIEEKYPGQWQVRDNKLYKGDVLINDNYEAVDTIKKNTGYLATIFLNGTRISTNVLSEDGNRAVGTKATDTVIETVIEKGEVYKGDAIVAGKKVVTYYKPIKDSAGKVIGMWFMGIEKAQVQEQILHIVGIIGAAILIVLLIGIGIAYYIGNKM